MLDAPLRTFTDAVLSLFVILLVSTTATAQSVPVENPSFESGSGTPVDWMLSGGQGDWLQGDAADGDRAVSVTGNGSDSNYWRTDVLGFEPSSLYQLSFQARNISGAGGTPTSGPAFCNVDLSVIPDQWLPYGYAFASPDSISASLSFLRFGQWQVAGEVAFDAVSLVAAEAVYTRFGGLFIGEGESISGQRYRFDAPYNGFGRNHSRPLAYYNCRFNTNRWTVYGTDYVVYRHNIGDVPQAEASVTVSVIYHVAGSVAVQASPDGATWSDLGVIESSVSETFDIPQAMLPARDVWIRLVGRATGTGAASLQVAAYVYEASLDGASAQLFGATEYFGTETGEPGIDVSFVSCDVGVGPGGENELVLKINNSMGASVGARPTLTFRQEGREPIVASVDVTLPPGEREVRIPYALRRSGRYDVTLELGPGFVYMGRCVLTVSDLDDASYGEMLPGSTPNVGLWWASSGRNIGRVRPVPEAVGSAVTIRAASNETEAAQIVLRPADDLENLTVSASDLSGPGGAVIASDAVDILRVRYVPVSRPTDSTGVAGLWPDPLPPFAGPLDIPAGVNQPLWVRVKVPKATPAGTYTGTVSLQAIGYSSNVNLIVQVYPFELPDRMTCKTAFGLSTPNVFRYHKLTAGADKRAVTAKYLRNMAEHHISPYNPTPLDPFEYSWPVLDLWSGGVRDDSQRHSGVSSLFLEDVSATQNVSALCDRYYAIPAEGMRLSFWYKTQVPGHSFIVSLGHIDAAGDWMSGRNNDIVIDGTGQWQYFEQVIDSFPAGAVSVRLSLWAARWVADGSTTGAVWFDDVSLENAATGAEFIAAGGFEPPDEAALTPVFEWTAYDAAMAKAMDEYHFNSFDVNIVGLGGGTFHSRYEPSLLGYSEDTPEYQMAFSAYAGAVEDHLAEKGWLEDSYVYWFDEPAPDDYDFVMNGFSKLKEHCPGIGRMLTEQVEPGLVGGPNIWCPVSNNYDHESAEARRAAGETFWWYVCTGPKAPYATLFIDHSAAELRLWLWQTWQRNITGVLIWQTNYWTSDIAYPNAEFPQNPYEDPMSWVSGYGTPVGSMVPWGNGDGRLLYPPEAAADGRQAGSVLAGPVDSQRWEMLRDGIEDYEYLAMLSRLIDAHAAVLSPEDEAHLRSFLEVPEYVSSGMTTFTTDPRVIEARRHEVAAAIGALMGDSDVDGMDDDWEMERFGNLDEDAAGDFDDDGIANGDEAALGTDPTQGDHAGPVTGSVATLPSVLREGADTRVSVAAAADDVSNGNSRIAAAECFIGADPGTGAATAMSAADGAFDAPVEALLGTLNTSPWTAGIYDLNVRAQDAAGHWGGVEKILLEVLEGRAPAAVSDLAVSAAVGFGLIAKQEWNSAGEPAPGIQTKTLDLGSARSVGAVSLESARPPGFFPTDFDILLSEDGIDWSRVASGRGLRMRPGACLWQFEAMSARYVRVEARGRRNRRDGHYYVSIAGIGVHDAGGVPMARATWRATADDGASASSGPASAYDLRVSAEPITEADFDSCVEVAGLPPPAVKGTPESAVFPLETSWSRVYAALRVSDEVGNRSGISNVAECYVAMSGLRSDYPEDAISLEPGPPIQFAYAAGPELTAVAIVFSDSPDFPARPVLNPDGSKAKTLRCPVKSVVTWWKPSQGQWRSVRKLAALTGVVYWRLEARSSEFLSVYGPPRAVCFDTGSIVDLGVSPSHDKGGGDAVWPVSQMPPSFFWRDDSLGMKSFYIDVSADEQIVPGDRRRTVSIGGSRITGNSYTPSAAEWKKIRRLASVSEGELYWRVRALDEYKALRCVSAVRPLLIDGGEWSVSQIDLSRGDRALTWNHVGQGIGKYGLEFSVSEEFCAGPRETVRLPSRPFAGNSYTLSEREVARLALLASRSSLISLHYRVRGEDSDRAFVAVSPALTTPAP